MQLNEKSGLKSMVLTLKLNISQSLYNKSFLTHHMHILKFLKLNQTFLKILLNQNNM